MAEDGDRLLDCEAIARLMSCSKRTVWRMVERGELPRPIRFSSKMSRWKKSVVEYWFSRLGVEEEANRG